MTFCKYHLTIKKKNFAKNLDPYIFRFTQDVTDSELYSELMVGAGDDSYRKGVIINMIRELQEDSIFSR